MSTLFLKVKIKSLAAEAQIIRKEEVKRKGRKTNEPLAWNDIYCDLHKHRVLNVRQEARATLLAYAYLRQRTYKQVEGKAVVEPSFWNQNTAFRNRVIRVAELLVKYRQPSMSKDIAIQRVLYWMEHNDIKASNIPL